MKANFACPLDRVVARRSVSVWRHRAENCCVEEPSKARARWYHSPSHGCCGCSVVVVRVVCCAVFFARVTIFFSYPTVRTNSAMK